MGKNKTVKRGTIFKVCQLCKNQLGVNGWEAHARNKHPDVPLDKVFCESFQAVCMWCGETIKCQESGLDFFDHRESCFEKVIAEEALQDEVNKRKQKALQQLREMSSSKLRDAIALTPMVEREKIPSPSMIHQWLSIPYRRIAIKYEDIMRRPSGYHAGLISFEIKRLLDDVMETPGSELEYLAIQSYHNPTPTIGNINHKQNCSCRYCTKKGFWKRG